MKEQKILVDLPEGYKDRLDRYLADLNIMTRAQMKSRNLKAYHEGSEMKFSAKVRNGMALHITWEEEWQGTVEPEEIPLDILYEDKNVVVINKPRGLVVHPAVGNWSGTLVNGLLYYLKQGNTSDHRPGIVHRLDKDTSGVIITAKNVEAQEFLSRQFQERETEKQYLAVLRNHPPRLHGTVEGYLQRDKRNRKKIAFTDRGGKWSLSHYQVIERFEKYCLVEVKIETGRTHQIRVHMQSFGCPVLGDPLYSRKDASFPDVSLMLHSQNLTITLPGEEEPRTFEAPIPDDFNAVMTELRSR